MPFPHSSRYARHLKKVSFFFVICLVDSLQSSLGALSTALAAGEDLVGGFVADGIEQAAFPELVGDAFVYALLDVVDARNTGDFCLVEFIWSKEITRCQRNRTDWLGAFSKAIQRAWDGSAPCAMARFDWQTARKGMGRPLISSGESRGLSGPGVPANIAYGGWRQSE